MSTSQELKRYLYYMDKIKSGTEVVAINCEYEGLKGVITDVYSGNDRLTNNECLLDILVDFYIPQEIIDNSEDPDKWIEENFPQLEGTGISQVVMSEDMLAYDFDNNTNFYITLEEQVVCPNCCKLLNRAIETQYNDIEWIFNNGKYEKKTLLGDSNGIRCPYCNTKLIDEDIEYFKY